MLTLRQIRWEGQGEAYRRLYPDYAVSDDGQEIGRIYRSHAARSETEWFWAINKGASAARDHAGKRVRAFRLKLRSLS